jgi:hypothetical protein
MVVDCVSGNVSFSKRNPKNKDADRRRIKTAITTFIVNGNPII